MKPSRELLERIIAEVLAEQTGIGSSSLTSSVTHERGQACTRPPPPIHGIPAPASDVVLRDLVATTSSQIAVGRTGTRLRTDLYLRLREGHADAKDAVHSDVPETWASDEGLIALQTQCRDRQEHLLFPNHGRRLDAPSLVKLDSEGDHDTDVQVLVGDGLSSLAVLKNGKETLRAIERALMGRGFRIGRSIFVRFARIGVADEIGVRLRARATVILVGERPGLGTGDSLSVYIAVAPKLDQDNAEKNCVSNVRPIGIKPDEAGGLTAEIIARGLAAGRGGVALGLGYGRQ